MPRFERYRGFPDQGAEEQVSSIEGASRLRDDQREILHRLAVNLIIAEFITSPEDVQKTLDELPLRMNLCVGVNNLVEGLQYHNDVLTCIKDALESEIPAGIISALLDRESLSKRQEA